MLYYWKGWLTQKYLWIPTITLIPVVYLVGWILSQLFSFAFLKLAQNQIALIGTIFSFSVFLLLMPSWSRYRWNHANYITSLGLNWLPLNRSIKSLFRGFFYSFVLISFILIPVLSTSWGHWKGELNIGVLLNAIALAIGVGFAEEVIFRGWLLTEMNFLVRPQLGCIFHASIFSVVHARFNIGFWPLIGILIGLFLLGLALALIKKLDIGSLWGCIGLHGGLVGGWFVVSNGLVQFSPDTPGWLFGPGGSELNPIGGFLAIFALLLFLIGQRIAFAIGRAPFKGARNDSSRGAFP